MDFEESKEIGERHINDICPSCKVIIEEATKNITKKDLLRPKKLAKRFANLVCAGCRDRIARKLHYRY